MSRILSNHRLVFPALLTAYLSMFGSVASAAIYVDPAYGFSVDYPAGFIVRPRAVETLNLFPPLPDASVVFLNPTKAAGEHPEIEAPDLEVRVYPADSASSLKGWLLATQLATADELAGAQDYKTARVSGLKLCRSTMIAPNCFIAILHEHRVYQLLSLSQEGDVMMKSFTLP